MGASGKSARRSAAIVLEAVSRAGVRAVLQGWDRSLLDSLAASPSVYCAGSLPHGWLFAQAAAVVHHGGFGTTAAGLRSGAPSIVIPHIIDQFAWGQTVSKLGAGPAPIPRARLSPVALAQAIEVALHDERVMGEAARIGQSIRSEPDGVTEAVRLIEDLRLE
jgi:sterol 3beta-glucosyltransferase